jgi:hypothetical protein
MRDSPSAVSTDETEVSADDFRVIRFEERPWWGVFSFFVIVFVFLIYL